jgi:aminoglycoside/choline kinase family phosphotransferase
VPAEAASSLDRWLGGGNWVATAVAGDASTRRYFRVTSPDGTAILTWYPPDVREGLARFLAASKALSGRVRIPEVREHDEACVLQQDVGEQSLSRFLEQDRDAAMARYRDAAAIAESFGEVGEPGHSVNPAFDRKKFTDELDMTRQYYVEQLCRKDSRRLEGPFGVLAERLTRHPYVLCHRDYHGDNLYIFNNNLYAIDYQDMRLGPDTYDLASLLRDRGVWQKLGRELEQELVSRHAAVREERLGDVRNRYLESLLQRSIKAIGTFARLVVVYGRRQYLAYIGPTLETVDECAAELDEWRELRSLFPFDYRHLD